jgi:predicted outer membrane repeat protein
VCGLALAALAPAALANTYHPNKTGDHAPNGCSQNDCTLREAVITANNHPGADTIVLRGGKTYRRSGTPGSNEDFAADGDLDVRSPLTIKSSSRRLATVNAQHNERVFEVPYTSGSSASRLDLQRLKVMNGSMTGFAAGGGVVVADLGQLTVTRSVIVGNSAYVGGGLALAPSTVIAKSTLRDNRAQYGGGIYAIDDPFTLKTSTLSGNRATVDGGGVYVENADVGMANDTISGNQARGNGGGINSTEDAVVRMNAVTVARNRADSDSDGFGDGGGLFGDLGQQNYSLKNSLIALNTGHAGPNCHTGLTSGGENLFGPVGANCVGTTSDDFLDVPSSKTKLGELRDNGGPTETHALGRRSKAINHAGGDAPPRDQRGHKRHNPDIGAFER